jgi:hypothetical protein
VSAPVGNPYLGSWVETALRLEAERDELRDTLSALLFWILENRELLDLAEKQIESRWPHREAA